MSNEDTVVILDQASGYLKIDMLEAYQKKYSHQVIIAGTIVERSKKLPNSVVWHNIPKYNRTTVYRRIWSWMMGSIAMFYYILFKYRNAHIVAVTNPPFSVFIPWITRSSYDILIYDMYPDALEQYGYTRSNGILYRVWTILNRKVFKNASRIFTLTNGMKELAEKYCENTEKIKVVPLWSDDADFVFVPKNENEILKKTNSLGKFVLVYSGNLGKTHPIEKLVDLGSKLDPDLFSVIIIGSGAKEKMIREKLINGGYNHIHLLPWQPYELLSHNLYAADLNVVTLDSVASKLSIPSKTFNIMSIGNPILGICELDSGLAEVVQKYDCGIISNGNDIEKLAKTIERLQSNPAELKRMKENSKIASTHFTSANANLYL